MINGVNVLNPSYEKLSELAKDSTYNDILARGKEYVGIKGFVDKERVVLYDNAPAINARLNGAILDINGNKILSVEDLGKELGKYEPGETVNVKTKTNNETINYKVILGENPENPDSSWLGVGFLNKNNGGVMAKIFGVVSVKELNVYYEPRIGEFGWFVYHLLWWLIIISFSVALVNMLPMGIFDGGRFFYLTVLLITKSEEKAKKSFKWMTYLFLLIISALMIFWAYAMIF